MLISSWYGVTHLTNVSQPCCHSSTKHVNWPVVGTAINLYCLGDRDFKFHGIMGLAAKFHGTTGLAAKFQGTMGLAAKFQYRA